MKLPKIWRPISDVVSLCSLKSTLTNLLNPMSIKLFCSLFAISIPWFWVGRNSVLKDGPEDITSMMVIWPSAPMSNTIIWPNTIKFLMMILNISTEKSCTVVILPISGIEEPITPISKSWLNLNWCKIAIFLLDSSPLTLPNSIMMLIETISRPNCPLNHPFFSVCIPMLKSGIWLLCAIPFSTPLWTSKEDPVAEENKTLALWISSWIWRTESPLISICSISKQKSKTKTLTWSSLSKNVKEWMFCCSKSRPH